MDIVLLGAWVIQVGVGIALFVGWLRHAHGAGRPAVSAHVSLMLIAFASWTVFVATDAVVWAWCAWAILTVGIGFGDYMMVRRYRGLEGMTRPGLGDYAPAIGAVFRGRMPGKVAFHAVFSAVVYFGSLGVAIAASIM